MGKWLLLLCAVAACGDDGGAAPDGASPDGAQPDGDANGATVVFHANRLSNRGPVVYCRDASGALTQRIVVGNGLGETSVVCPMVDGGMVDILLDMDSNLARFEAYRHLSPGVTIEVDQPVGGSISDDGTMTINVPSSPTVAGTPTCGDVIGSTMTAGTWHAWAPCDANPVQILMTDSPFTPSQYIYLPSVTFSANGSIDAGPWLPLTTTPSTFTGLPGNAEDLSADVYELLSSDGGGYAAMGQADVPAPDATATLDLPIPGGNGVGADTFVITAVEIGGITVDQHAILAANTAAPVALAIGYDDQPLPRPSAVTPNATGVTWTETGGPAGDLREVAESWTLPGNTIVDWFVFDDPTAAAGGATIYGLGADDADIDLTVAASATPSIATVSYVDYDVVDGWAAARAKIPELVNLADALLGVAHQAHATQSQSGG